MKHYGDITKINGHDVPLVDIVTGGSPCQDLSVAGKRAGLQGERSGLFMEQIRIIKEMRDESIRQLSMRRSDYDIRDIKPRYMVWENVPGAFSSNKGEDFRCVLEEICRVEDKTATVPMPEKGKWSSSGCIMGDGWSVAWRLHDAQFWGVPQRRKRISLVADFGGQSAPEILFERKGVSGDSEQSESKGEETTRTVGTGLDSTSFTLKIRGGVERDSKGNKAGKGALVQTELSGTLGVSQDQTLITNCLNSWDVQSKHIQPENGKAEALYSGECRGGGGESYVMQGVDIYNRKLTGDVVAPLTCNSNATSTQPTVMQSTYQTTTGCLAPGAHAGSYNGQDAYNDMLVTTPVISIEGNGSRESHRGNGYKESETMYSLNTVEQHGVCYGIDAYNQSASEEVAHPIRSKNADTDHVPNVCYGLDRASFNQGKNALYDFSVEEEKAQPLVARGLGGVMTEQRE